MDAAQGPSASRRRVLVGLSGLALSGLTGLAVAGCTTTAGVARPSAATRVDDDDIKAAKAAAGRAVALVAAYGTAGERHPSLRPLLDALRAHHSEHRRALDERIPAAAGASATADPGSTGPAPSRRGGSGGSGADAGTAAVPGATPDGAAQTVDESPAARRATLTALTAMEGEAATATRTDCLRVHNSLAPLLASVCAAESAHVDLLVLYTAQVAG